MKPSVQLLLTALLVGAGLFVYDTIRGTPPETAAPVEIDRPAPPRETVDEEEPPSLVMLEGTGDDLWRDAIERRLAELEQGEPHPDGTTAAVGGADTPTTLGGVLAGPEGEDAPADGEHVDDEATREARREQLQRFRRMLEAVERQRRWEKEAAGIGKFLNGLDLQLTDDQRRDVIRTTVHYKSRWQGLAKMPRNDDQEKEARRDAGRALYGEFEQAIRDLVPSTEADVIFQGLRDANRQRPK